MNNPTEKHNGAGPLPNTTIQLVISLDQLTGQINVSGPVGNMMVCYGMLEMAKDALRSFQSQQQRSGIIGASAMPRVA